MRVSGAKAGVLTFVFDAAKGAAACAMGYFVFKYLVFGGVSGVSAEILHPIHGAFFCGIACMIGHCWPVFFQFRGCCRILLLLFFLAYLYIRVPVG